MPPGFYEHWFSLSVKTPTRCWLTSLLIAVRRRPWTMISDSSSLLCCQLDSGAKRRLFTIEWITRTLRTGAHFWLFVPSPRRSLVYSNILFSWASRAASVAAVLFDEDTKEQSIKMNNSVGTEKDWKVLIWRGPTTWCIKQDYGFSGRWSASQIAHIHCSRSCLQGNEMTLCSPSPRLFCWWIQPLTHSLFQSCFLPSFFG